MALYLTVSLALALRKVKDELILSAPGGGEASLGYGKVTIPLDDALRYSPKEDDYIPMSGAYGKPLAKTFELNTKGIELIFPPAEEGICYYFSDEDSERILGMGLQNVWLAEH